MNDDNVKVTHWWPGRQWRGPSPIPAFMIEEAKRRKSRYLTYAQAGGYEDLCFGAAFCCPKDAPSRALGREIALGRLAKSRGNFDGIAGLADEGLG